jgi:general secretion pathway protein G
MLMLGRSRRRRTRKAFSLLEVLLVVVILGILAAFVVPNLIGSSDKAKIGITEAGVAKGGAIALALDLYRTHVGSYPETLKDLTEKPSDEEKSKKWNGPYINDPNSLKDSWGHEFQYKLDGDHNGQGNYDLWSWGPDGQDGTDDDIGNWTKG